MSCIVGAVLGCVDYGEAAAQNGGHQYAPDMKPGTDHTPFHNCRISFNITVA